MYCIKREDIDTYRFAIGKYCFLKCYQEYGFVEDLTYLTKKSCLRVFNKSINDESSIVVSIFSSPDEKDAHFLVDDRVEIYYQKGPYGKSSKKNTPNINRLSSDFDAFYNECFALAVTDPAEFLKQVKADGDVYFSLFKDVLFNNYVSEDSQKHVFKYHSKDKFFPINGNGSIQQYAQDILDGYITFVSPSTLNDPFDINCFFANGIDISGLFRIFCVAPRYDNILMWSYYGQEHKGYCFEYSDKDIMNVVFNEKRKGLAIVGPVTYSSNRPKQRSSYNSLTYSELKFYADAAFTKYEGWKHEEEYRYVMLFWRNISASADINEKEYINSRLSAGGDFMQYRISHVNVYEGVNGPGVSLKDSNGNAIIPIRLKKDSTSYGLHI